MLRCMVSMGCMCWLDIEGWYRIAYIPMIIVIVMLKVSIGYIVIFVYVYAHVIIHVIVADVIAIDVVVWYIAAFDDSIGDIG